MKMRPPHPLYVQFYDLLLIELSNWRRGWRNLALAGMVLPVFGILVLGSLARDLGVETLSFVLVGNLVMALLFEHKGKLISHFAFMKAVGSLDYFATLPVPKPLLILAACRRLLPALHFPPCSSPSWEALEYWGCACICILWPCWSSNFARCPWQESAH